MVFTYVRWERGAVSGVVAYVLGFFSMHALPASAVSRALATRGTDPYGKPLPPLAVSIPDGTATWKLLGWLWHGSLLSPVATRFPGSSSTFYVNPIVGIQPDHWFLYLIAPALLVALASFVVVASWTPGPRCGLYTGAMTVLGFVLACFAGSLLFTVGYPANGPDPLTSVFRAGLLYPLVFGGAGGVLGRTIKNHLGVTYESDPDDIWAYDNRRTGDQRRW